ncbi:MAG: prepilin-type N-terminal cleavage/methylation domain-containing protein [Puniceicoccales bacterium]|jgi:prepilin-type N-terminal cleavage/methylation domain-containing protein|nr:prepilin-type N-terminal cleavage/methylation domain-containing protein [Puniceicoccales bacterium]
MCGAGKFRRNGLRSNEWHRDRHRGGFTLLEMLLTLVVFSSLFFAISRFIGATSESLCANLFRVDRAIDRSKLLQFLEKDLANIDGITYLPGENYAVAWQLHSPPLPDGNSVCAYVLDKKTKRLHRILVASTAAISPHVLGGCSVFLENVAEFSLFFVDDDKFRTVRVRSRFDGEMRAKEYDMSMH